MSAALDDPAVRAYLAELERALGRRPAEERDLVLDGVRQHIADALGGGPADPAQVQRVLDGLGDPVAIAAESAPQREEFPAPALAVSLLDRRGGAVLTVLVLAFGGLVVPVLGWIAGVVLLRSARGWRTVDKVIGTATAPVLVACAAGTVLLLHATAGASAAPDPSDGQTSLGPLLPEPYDLIWGGLVLAPLLQLAVGVYLLLRFRPLG